MIIGKGMTTEEKEVSTEMLCNRKAMSAWDLIEMRKVKRKVALLQKIRTVDHKTWQVPGFQISKALISLVINML